MSKTSHRPPPIISTARFKKTSPPSRNPQESQNPDRAATSRATSTPRWRRWKRSASLQVMTAEMVGPFILGERIEDKSLRPFWATATAT